LTGLVDDTYLATTIVDTLSGLHEVDARPSDALNLAGITHAPITADPSILY
jgi:bifunctional DNase/RNase